MEREKILLPSELKEKYGRQIKESEEIIKTAHSFKEPSRVPVLISAAGSYYAHMFGFDIKDYYGDADIQVEVQLRANAWRLENLRDDNPNTDVYLDIGPIAEGLLFDVPIVRPQGTSPRITTPVKDEDDIKNLKVPDPAKSEGLEWLERRFDRFRASAKKAGFEIVSPGPRLGIHPPLSAACAIMEPDRVYYLMAAKPDVIKDFLEKMFEAFCRVTDYYDRRYNIKREGLGLANDNTCFISNKMYVEQVLSYDKALYEKYGKKGRHLHTDGPSDHNFKTFADELKLTAMDIGGWSSIDAAVAAMKGRVVIHGGLNCKDVYGPLTEATRNKINHAIKTAAPGGGFEFAIGGETYVGVPPQTLIDLVNYVKEAGKYPIDPEI